MSNGHHVKEVFTGISNRLRPSVVAVTSLDGRIMRLSLNHSLGFMSVVAVYAPTEVGVPVVMHSLSWATLMLSLALKGLAMRYVLVPMALIPEMTTALSFQKAENCGFLVSETSAAPLDLV